MRRITILMMAVLLSTALAYGQKPKLAKVESMFKAGDYAGALEMVTMAETYEKTMNDPKTFYLKGLVYAAIDTAGLDLAENPRETALAAFAKYEEMEDSGKEETYVGPLGIFTYTQLKEGYYSYYFNKGANNYSNEEFADAVTNFGYAASIVPNDTTAYMYGGYAASNAEDYESAKYNYNKVIELGTNTSDIYSLLAYIYGTIDKDKEKALEVTRAAIVKFPSNNDLRRNEIQLLIEMEKIDEARDNLIKAIESEPNDAALRFSLGILYDNLSESAEDAAKKEELQKKALDAYNQAIGVDPNYLNAYFNIGVMMINRANEVIKESNNLGFSKADQKKAAQLEPIIKERLAEALPAWEKVNELEPNKQSTMETLQYLYVQLKMMDKAEAIMDKIDALKASQK